jgi:hypothetical protein
MLARLDNDSSGTDQAGHRPKAWGSICWVQARSSSTGRRSRLQVLADDDDARVDQEDRGRIGEFGDAGDVGLVGQPGSYCPDGSRPGP